MSGGQERQRGILPDCHGSGGNCSGGSGHGSLLSRSPGGSRSCSGRPRQVGCYQ